MPGSGCQEDKYDEAKAEICPRLLITDQSGPKSKAGGVTTALWLERMFLEGCEVYCLDGGIGFDHVYVTRPSSSNRSAALGEAGRRRMPARFVRFYAGWQVEGDC
jgi:hypothetical protein